MKRSSPALSKQRFSSILLKWNKEKNVREMPWKGEKNPYRIWLSEIILQQTRVDQGLNYYQRFISQYPDIHVLANAPEQEVFKLWEGLGYYTRCRNLIVTAKYISTKLDGKFPDQYETIRELKGVGPYTAAAISSFAYNLPHAVVDGNVFRVLARVFGIYTPIDSTKGKSFFNALAEELLNKKEAGIYNQAIMDFGAIICKPALPLCLTCPFKKHCVAFLQDKIDQLPVKEKKNRIRKRWFYYIVPEYKGQIAISQRKKKDIWEGLYEFQLLESATELNKKQLLQQLKKSNWFSPDSYDTAAISQIFKQQLSHQLIAGQFVHLVFNRRPASRNGWTWVSRKKAHEYAFPAFINQYLRG